MANDSMGNGCNPIYTEIFRVYTPIGIINLDTHSALVKETSNLIAQYEKEKDLDYSKIIFDYGNGNKVNRVKKTGKKSFYCNQNGEKGLNEHFLCKLHHHADSKITTDCMEGSNYE